MKRNAYEKQEDKREILRGEAFQSRASSTFTVLAFLPATMLRVDSELYETNSETVSSD